MTSQSRRSTLAAGASLAFGGLAGCLGDDSGTDGPTVFASFFTLAEFARNVAGEGFSVENAVPAEGHGHGWEPRTDLLPEILEAEAFVYLDADGFQPWAEEAAREIDANYADEVALIDALEGIEPIAYGDDHDDRENHGSGNGHEPDHEHDADHDSDSGHDTDHDSDSRHDADHDSDNGHDTDHEFDPDHEHGPVAELEVIDRRHENVVAHHHFDHWHGELPAVPPGGSRRLGTRFVDGSGEPFPLGSGSPYQGSARIAPDAPETVELAAEGADVRIDGLEEGRTLLVFELREAGSVVWESEPIGVDVEETGEEASRDHGLVDVKFFSDPLSTTTAVRTVRDGLVELDPERADRYERNAAAYVDRLEGLHRQFQDRLVDREHDVAVLAGHDSFAHLGRRHGFEVHTPVGLSPDDEPSSADIAAAVDLVEERGIEYVLYDPFDGDRYAEAIAEEADGDVGTAMVSAAESYLEEWREEGYGDYLGQMEELTLPAFAKALGAR